jgi:hypothetical protein
MGPVELLSLLGAAFVKGALTQVGKHSVDAMAKWAADEARSRGSALSSEQVEELRALLGDDEQRLKRTFVAQLHLAQRRGTSIVGPSGSGKTAIFDFLATGRMSVSSTSPTGEVTHADPLTHWRYIRVHDTPGTVDHAAFGEHTLGHIRNKPIDVLLLVVSAGRLQTAGTAPFTRPGPVSYSNFEDYRNAALGEELEWLRFVVSKAATPKRPIPYFMVVVNKLDLWGNDIDAVMTYYEDGKPRAISDQIASAWCRKGVTPSFHSTAARYNSLWGMPPTGSMSIEAAETSLRILRAEIRARLLEAGS